MRFRTWLLALLVGAAAVIPATTATAETQRYVVLRGARTGWVDVRFPRGVSFDPDASVYRRTGDVAGFYVRPLPAPRFDESGSAVGASVSGFPFPFSLGAKRQKLPAATYRFYLLADAPATVKVAVTGLARDVDAPVRRPASLVANVASVPVTPDGPGRYRAHRSTVVRGGNRVVVTGIMRRLAPTTDPVRLGRGDVTECVKSLDSTGCTEATEPTFGIFPSSGGDMAGAGMWILPGDFDRPQRLHQHYGGTARPAEVRAVMLELTLAR